MQNQVKSQNCAGELFPKDKPFGSVRRFHKAFCLLMKKLSLCLVLFAVSSLGSAQMSDEEARAFLENLAKPSTEKRVFYRWQSEEAAENLLEAGEMTPKLYKHYMSFQDSFAGTGMYVAEDVVSSIDYGGHIIQVELEPGYKYLNLLDK